MELDKKILRTIHWLLDVAGLFFVWQQSMDETSADHGRLERVYKNLRQAAALWANDIYRRSAQELPQPMKSKEKTLLFEHIVTAINDAVYLLEDLPAPAFLAQEIKALQSSKEVFFEYAAHSAEVICRLRQETPETQMLLAFGDVLKEARS